MFRESRASVGVACKRHGGAIGAHGARPREIGALKAIDIDAVMVGLRALSVKRVDAALRNLKVPRDFQVPAIFRQNLFAGEQSKLVLVNLGHQRVLFDAKAAVAGGQLFNVCIDLEADVAAMA